MTTQLAPDPVVQEQEEVGDSFSHIVCILTDTSLCGLDMNHVVLDDGPVDEAECVVCLDILAEGKCCPPHEAEL